MSFLRSLFIISATVFFARAAYAEDITMFTTIFYDDGGIVYTGVKQIKENRPALSKVVMLPYPAEGSSSTLVLPDEVSTHDVIGLLPEREMLYVLTQDYENPQGNLTLHSFNKKTESWKRLGRTKCHAFTKIKLSHDRITAFCEMKQKSKKAKMHVVGYPFRLGRNRIYRTGSIRFPEFLLRYKGVNLLLEGKAPTWEKLHIKSEDSNKSYLAADFFQETSQDKLEKASDK